MNPLPPLASLADTRAAWRKRFLPCYWSNLGLGLLTLGVGAPLAWQMFGAAMPLDAVLALALTGLAFLPLLALLPALVMAGPFPSTTQYAKVAEFRQIYEAHRQAQAARTHHTSAD